MVNKEGRAWRVFGRSGAWVIGLAVFACARGDANRGGDSAAASTGGVAATPDTAQSTTAMTTDTAAAGQTQTTADTSGQQTAQAATGATTATKHSTASRTRSRTAAASSSASGDTAATTASTDTAAASDTDSTAQSGAAGSQQATAAGQSGAQQQGGDKMAVTDQVYQGWRTFAVNCERCHGQDAVGSSLAPSLIHSLGEGSVLGTGPVDHELFVRTVVDGRVPKGMPAWKGLLSDAQVEQLWAYLSARAKGGLPPGRPHVKKG